MIYSGNEITTNIVVSADSIKHGVQNYCNGCPITLSLFEKFDCSKVKIEVRYKVVLFNVFNFITKINLPDEAILFSYDYDSNSKVMPFNFDLVLPIELYNLIKL